MEINPGRLFFVVVVWVVIVVVVSVWKWIMCEEAHWKKASANRYHVPVCIVYSPCNVQRVENIYPEPTQQWIVTASFNVQSVIGFVWFGFRRFIPKFSLFSFFFRFLCIFCCCFPRWTYSNAWFSIPASTDNLKQMSIFRENSYAERVEARLKPYQTHLKIKYQWKWEWVEKKRWDKV